MKAHLKGQQGKRERANVIKYNFKKEEYTYWLYEKLKTRKYEHGVYTVFYVTEPKLRKIEASAYRDRIMHRWCVNRFLDKAFTPQFINTSYACIKGRGMHKVALDVQKDMKECKRKFGEYYVLKMAVAKYFPSINREIKDKDVLEVLDKIINSKSTTKGLPIANLTSQIFANVYYNEAD